MKLLLTGASGFVGRNLLNEVLRRNLVTEVHLPVRNPDKLRATLREDGQSEDPRIRIHSASAPDWGFRDMPSVDAVVHAAGVLFERSEDAYFKTNVEGTLRLLDQIPPDARVVVLSSQAASGPCQNGCEAISEGAESPPLTLYGRSKKLMEDQVLAKFPGRPVLFLRPPMILGPRDTATIPLFKMARGPLMLKLGWKPKTYSFISVLDLVDAILRALTHPREWTPEGPHRFFVAHPEPISDDTLMRALQRLTGRNQPILRLPHGVIRLASWIVDAIPALRKRQPALTRDRVQDLYEDRWVISPALFERTFAWKATRSLDDTLAAADDWLRKTGRI